MQIPVNINGEEILIDEMIQEIIPLLNKLGYKTVFSCEGHIMLNEEGKVEEKHSPYIAFDKSIEIEELQKLLQPSSIHEFDNGIGINFNKCLQYDDVFEFNKSKIELWEDIKNKLVDLEKLN